MTNKEFVQILKKAADAVTLYVKGGFGAPAGYGNNRTRYSKNNSYNKSRSDMILTAEDDCFFFDCVCLGKAILWGWSGDVNKVYGGANYTSNDVPDFSHQSLEKHCTEYGNITDINDLVPGEWLGVIEDDETSISHIGYYIGDGKLIEATPRGSNGVQVSDFTGRKWKVHGKIKYLTYEDEKEEKSGSQELVCPCCGAKLSITIKEA